MSYEITLGYSTGATLTYGVYQPDGTVRTAAGTSLPEVGTTGYYAASDANIIASDFVIVKEGTTIIAGGQYQPTVNTGITVDLTSIETKIDTLIAQGHTTIINESIGGNVSPQTFTFTE
jgi:hypothetical protein